MHEQRLEFRYLVTQPDLNAHGTLHGGILTKWADESAGMHARKLTRGVCVTRFISRINFVATARIGSIVKIVSTVIGVGNTSINFSVIARNDITDEVLATIDRITFVHVNEGHQPIPVPDLVF
jgi:acyl-CoA hydrolase